MMQPIFESGATTSRLYTDTFGGLCRTEEIKENEFCNMQNMSSRAFPFLVPARQMETVADAPNYTSDDKWEIECIIAPQLKAGEEIGKFTGVIKSTNSEFDYFYYNGVPKLKLEKQDRRRTLLDFNGNILIFPDKKYYSYADEGDMGSMTSAIKDDICFHSANSDTGESTYLEYPSGFTDGETEIFKVGDGLSINCPEEPRNCTYAVSSKYTHPAECDITACIVTGISEDKTKLFVNCYGADGELLDFVEKRDNEYNDENELISSEILFYNGVTVEKSMPDVVCACVSNNRVFGIDKYGETIYASKLGDFKNWNVFEGLTTDSWYGSVGTEGRFTGIATLGSSVVAFKDNYIHQIYGDSPNNFSIPKQIAAGCTDGRSIAEIRGQLYFLSYDGVYVFTGGNPVKISSALGDIGNEGVGGTDGSRYYLSVTAQDGGKELLVYDTERGLWHKEDNFNAVGFVRYNDGLYAANANALYKINSGTVGKWYAVSKRFDNSVMEQKGTVNIYFRLELPEGSKINIAVSADGGDFIECAKAEGIGRAAMRVPVRFCAAQSYQIKISGTGDAKIMAMERVVYKGGRNESNRTGGK